MTNQKYIEEIIKVAIDGEWSNYDTVTDIVCSTVRFDEGRSSTDLFKIFLDPNFFRAIGKVKGWGVLVCMSCKVAGWTTQNECKNCDNGGIGINTNNAEENMHTFLDKIIEKDLDHAIEWLYKLIKE